MSHKISEIKTVLNKLEGPARPTTYKIQIAPPAAMGLGAVSEDLLILCERCEIPGRQLATTPQLIYGNQRKIPYGPVYNDLALTFICTESMAERKFFEDWHSIIHNPNTNYMNYYDDYVSQKVVVQKLDTQGFVTHQVFLDEVYPITIEAQELSYGSTDTYLQLSVQLAYLRWRSEDDVAVSENGYNILTEPPSLFKPTNQGGEGYSGQTNQAHSRPRRETPLKRAEGAIDNVTEFLDDVYTDFFDFIGFDF